MVIDDGYGLGYQLEQVIFHNSSLYSRCRESTDTATIYKPDSENTITDTHFRKIRCYKKKI